MKVLIAIDGSESSMAAVESIIDRTWQPGDEFVVLKVVETEAMSPELPWAFQALDDDNHSSQLKVADAVARLEQYLPSMRVMGLTVLGNASDTIVRIAYELDIDLVVLAAHGEGAQKRYMIGSVTEAVVNRAPCSVETVRVKHNHQFQSRYPTGGESPKVKSGIENFYLPAGGQS